MGKEFVKKIYPFPDTNLKMLKYKLLSSISSSVLAECIGKDKEMWIICLTDIPHWYKRLLKQKFAAEGILIIFQTEAV